MCASMSSLEHSARSGEVLRDSARVPRSQNLRGRRGTNKLLVMLTGGGVLAVLFGCGAGAHAAGPPARGPNIDPPGEAALAPRPADDSLIGVIDQPAAPWQVSQWFNSPPLSLAQLRGKVVFVRWFMGPS